MSEQRKWIVIWCETGTHTWAINSIDGFLDYVHRLWSFSKMLEHNLPRKERRTFDARLGEAMLRNTREHVVSCLLTDGYIVAECSKCRIKRTLKMYQKTGIEVVSVGEFIFTKEVYDSNKERIEKIRNLCNLGAVVESQ